jgi:hypothetical protein
MGLQRWPARSKARVPGFDRVGRVSFFLNQNDVVLVKKTKKNQKSTGLQPGLAGSPVQPAGSH